MLNNPGMVLQVARPVTSILAVVVAGLWVAGCIGTPLVPPELQEGIERDVSFQQIKISPLSYLGKIVVVGGTMLSVKPLKQGGARIEVLQLPLTSDDEPYGRLMDSNGRFFAFHKEFLDPATIPSGTRITVVGDVTGSTTSMVDEFEYSYPTCDILSLTIWPSSLPTYVSDSIHILVSTGGLTGILSRTSAIESVWMAKAKMTLNSEAPLSS